MSARDAPRRSGCRDRDAYRGDREPGWVPLSDLNMMVLLTGRERTLAEYGSLLEEACLRIAKSTPIRSPMAVIDAVAA